jgi:di/tricarboxylate transporter
MGALASGRISVDFAMVGALTLLILAGAVEPLAGVEGFASRAVVMIAALYVVAAGLVDTGAMRLVVDRMLGRPKTLAGAQLRMMIPVAAMSAFMNNTPIVAMFVPVVSDWGKRNRISPSHLLMPLSFAAILGGSCTLIGTAPNIAVTEKYVAWAETSAYAAEIGLSVPSQTKQMWWVGAIGLPAAVVGIGFIVLASRRLLAERRPAGALRDESRKYTVAMVLEAGSPLVGRSIEAAGLRQLPGLYLVEIERDDQQIPAPGPMTRLAAGDVLVFVGVIESVVDLRKFKGLVPATDQVSKVNAARRQRLIVEAVVSDRAPFVRQSIRESRFRTNYNAAIIAVHRGGERVGGKVGDIVLEPGDTLLLETHLDFVESHRNTTDFYLVSRVDGAEEPRFERAPIALAIVALFVTLLSLGAPIRDGIGRLDAAWGAVDLPEGTITPMTASLLCACLMILTRCTTTTRARQQINWQVLLVVGAALGIGSAMENTGAAAVIAETVMGAARSLGPHGVLFAMFLLVNLVTQFVTNVAAAVLMLPVVLASAEQLGVNPEPFVVVLMSAAACSFATPIGYQTNLMVFGPGGYRFGDFVRLGLPLTVLIAGVATAVAPIVFPF